MDSVSENVSENASEKVSENVSENVSEKVSENVSDARLSQIFGEALGDEPSKEETLAAWEAFEKKHISSEEEHLQKAEDELSEKKIEDEIGRESSSRKISKARILAWITASVAVAASLQEIITALNEMGVAKVRIEKGKIMVL